MGVLEEVGISTTFEEVHLSLMSLFYSGNRNETIAWMSYPVLPFQTLLSSSQKSPFPLPLPSTMSFRI